MRTVIFALCLIAILSLVSTSSAKQSEWFWLCDQNATRTVCSKMPDTPAKPSGLSIGQIALNAQATCRVLSEQERFAWLLVHKEERWVECSKVRGYIDTGLNQANLLEILEWDVRLSSTDPSTVKP